MSKLSESRGLGVVEWILIVILVLMVLVTLYLLLRPALGNLLQEFLESMR